MGTTNYPGAIDGFTDVPDNQATPKTHQDQHDDLNAAMVAVQTRVGTTAAPALPPRFASTTARSTAIPSPVKGMVCVVDGELQVFDGTAWIRAHKSGATPYAMAAGEVSWTGNGTQFTDVTVTLPAGRFTTMPIVTVNLNSSTLRIVVFRWGSGSKDQVILRALTTDGANISNGTPFAGAWVAVQMTPTSAAG